MNINLAISKNIKGIRIQKKLTLDSAANVTGVSRSMLAQIEKGESNPTISILWKIANGYKVSFTSLIEESPEPITTIPFSTIQPIIDDEGKYINYPIFHFNEQRSFETYQVLIFPDGGLQAEPHLSGTEEYITVFAGCIKIEANSKTFHLNEGDSIRFIADTPHSYKNLGTVVAKLSMLLYYPK
ncbi:MAG: helix-turn-helix domain-containing protein [Eubacteriaceae bacterium]